MTDSKGSRSGSFDGLDGRQIVAASLTAWGVDNEAIAARVGVSVRTIYQWKKIPAFKRLVTDFCDHTVAVQRETWAGVLSGLLGGSSAVFERFRREFIEPSISEHLTPDVKLRAYQLYWRFVTHSIESLDFHERLTRLENGGAVGGSGDAQD